MNTTRQDLRRGLAQLGYRMTSQRELLLEVLGSTGGHLNAETLLRRVRKVYPRVNKSVVYRNLELLAQLGLISCVDLGQGRVEYEVHRHPHHHHLVCRNCHRVIEISSDAFPALQQRLQDEFDFTAELDHLAIFGLCSDCRGKPALPGSHHPHAL